MIYKLINYIIYAIEKYKNFSNKQYSLKLNIFDYY